jgi:hypothetical protein
MIKSSPERTLHFSSCSECVLEIPEKQRRLAFQA